MTYNLYYTMPKYPPVELKPQSTPKEYGLKLLNRKRGRK